MRVAARMAAFIPAASPPLVSTAMRCTRGMREQDKAGTAIGLALNRARLVSDDQNVGMDAQGAVYTPPGMAKA